MFVLVSVVVVVRAPHHHHSVFLLLQISADSPTAADYPTTLVATTADILSTSTSTAAGAIEGSGSRSSAFSAVSHQPPVLSGMSAALINH